MLRTTTRYDRFRPSGVPIRPRMLGSLFPMATDPKKPTEDEVIKAVREEAIRCPVCKKGRVYGAACVHCGDEFKAHPTVMEHLANEKSKG